MANEVDLRRNYKLEPGNVLITNTVDAINESIKNILGTMVGSRLFNRGFGSRLAFLLFEPMSEITSTLIKLEIQDALDVWEPRVEIVFGQSEIIPIYDKNIYQIRLVYRIIDSQDVGEFDSFLESNG